MRSLPCQEACFLLSVGARWELRFSLGQEACFGTSPGGVGVYRGPVFWQIGGESGRFLFGAKKIAPVPTKVGPHANKGSAEASFLLLWSRELRILHYRVAKFPLPGGVFFAPRRVGAPCEFSPSVESCFLLPVGARWELRFRLSQEPCFGAESFL